MFAKKNGPLPRLAPTPLQNPIVRSLNAHPRRWMMGIGVMLLGTGVTAFGLAPLASGVDQLPVRQVTESIEFAHATDLPAHQDGFVLFRTDQVRRDDTAHSLLQRLGVRDRKAQAFLASHANARQLFSGRNGKLVSVETDDRQQLKKLVARWLPDDGRQFQRLTVEATADGLVVQQTLGNLSVRLQLASGVINSSLFAATDAVGMPDSVAVQLAQVFESEIDFRRDLRTGDRFSVVYESLEADGEVLRAGRVLSAAFTNNGREHEAVWFEEPGQKGAYFGFDGQSQRKSFLASPLEFSRVSSGYGMRFHPISGLQKAHLGVDYAAPTGTPVRTIGDGVVTFAGVQRGYGNVIEISHADQKSTLYAHLSRIDVRQGQRVLQGDFVGAVGSTGHSTGPHLHFEFRDAGVHQDPLEIARQSQNIPVSAASRALFDRVASEQRLNLNAASTMRQASAE